MFSLKNPPKWLKYIAIDKDGTIRGFNQKPKYDKNRGIWEIEINGSLVLMTILETPNIKNVNSENSLKKYP